MITKIKFFLSLTILLILSIKSYSNENIYIVYKVNNEIITNSDIEKEYQYLSVYYICHILADSI